MKGMRYISSKAINTKIKKPNDEPSVYKCVRCNRTRSDAKGYFYLNKKSPLYTANDGYCHICSTCVNDLFFEHQTRFKDLKLATIFMCHYLDIYFSEELFDSMKDKTNFSFGVYVRTINGQQYGSKNFVNTILELLKNGFKDDKDLQEIAEQKWNKEEIKNKNEAINIIGYDPFEGYSNNDRRFLFNELVRYFDDDVVDDTYKLSQIIQIVNNNNQIRQYDICISSLNPTTQTSDIKALNDLKKNLVVSNDKIAKENEISVKNRSNKDVGKSTLTYLLKDLREKDIKNSEVNYYKQLRSEGTLWGIEMSMKAIQNNTYFDENDIDDIKDMRLEYINQLQQKNDDLLEENRLLKIKMQGLENGDINE